MSLAQQFRIPEQSPSQPKEYSWRRLALLCALLLISIGFNVYMLLSAPPIDTQLAPFIIVWLVSFAPYIAACVLVLLTRPSTGKQRWIELGLILLGGLALRAILLTVLPNLSHDLGREFVSQNHRGSGIRHGQLSRHFSNKTTVSDCSVNLAIHGELSG